MAAWSFATPAPNSSPASWSKPNTKPTSTASASPSPTLCAPPLALELVFDTIRCVLVLDLNLLRRAMRLTSGITPAIPACVLPLLLLAVTPSNLNAQRTNSSSVLAYPDTQDGLEHFAKDLLKAHKQGIQPDEVRRLVQSLSLPNPRAWFSMVFGEHAYEPLVEAYSRNQDSLLQEVDAVVVAAARDGFSEIRAKKYEKSCDDMAGELTFPLLMARIVPVPLYELRMMGASSFRRISIFAYVEGAFRYVGPLNIPDEFAPAPGVKPTARIQLPGNVQAAKNTKKVAPSYPDAAPESAWKARSGFRRLSVLMAVCDRSAPYEDIVRSPRFHCRP